MTILRRCSKCGALTCGTDINCEECGGQLYTVDSLQSEESIFDIMVSIAFIVMICGVGLAVAAYMGLIIEALLQGIVWPKGG